MTFIDSYILSQSINILYENMGDQNGLECLMSWTYQLII